MMKVGECCLVAGTGGGAVVSLTFDRKVSDRGAVKEAFSALVRALDHVSIKEGN